MLLVTKIYVQLKSFLLSESSGLEAIDVERGIRRRKAMEISI